MLGRCSSSSQGNNSFSMQFSATNGSLFDPHDPFVSSSFSSSSSVDCTLSLGTPSTRLSEEDEKRRFSSSSSYNMSGFGWEFFPTDGTAAPYGSQPHRKTGRGSGTGSGRGDLLLARRCANCDTTSTPLWRNGPRGPKSLCNACGIRFKKEERRATAANTTSGGGSATSGASTDHYHNTNYYNPSGTSTHTSSWVQHHFMDGVSDRESDVTANPFLCWRNNVADRASLVHDFTR